MGNAEYMGHSCPHRARTKMKSLLVCLSVVAVAFAEEEAPKPLLLPALGYPYGGLPYAYAHPTVQVAAPEITLVSKFQSFHACLETRFFQTRNFEKPHFSCSKLQ